MTLKSSRAKGRNSLLHPHRRGRIEQLVRSAAVRRDIRLYRFVNVGNHLHLVLKTRSRRGFQNFLREIAGKIALVATGATKGNPSGRFWDHLAWSRVVEWGRDFRGLHRYIIKNIFEAHGLYTRRDRIDRRKVISIPFGHGPPPPGSSRL